MALVLVEGLGILGGKEVGVGKGSFGLLCYGEGQERARDEEEDGEKGFQKGF